MSKINLDRKTLALLQREHKAHDLTPFRLLQDSNMNIEEVMRCYMEIKMAQAQLKVATDSDIEDMAAASENADDTNPADSVRFNERLKGL